jgi:hypothetical protein
MTGLVDLQRARSAATSSWNSPIHCSDSTNDDDDELTDDLKQGCRQDCQSHSPTLARPKHLLERTSAVTSGPIKCGLRNSRGAFVYTWSYQST